MSIQDGFTWTIHPYARYPWRGHLALLAILATGALASWVAGTVLGGLIALAVLLASTLSFFVATQYRITSDGIQVDRLGNRALWRWSTFRSVQRSGASVWLSPFPAGSWAARLRSVRVDLPEEGRDEVSEYVRSRIGERRD